MTKNTKKIPFSLLRNEIERRLGDRKMLKLPIAGQGRLPMPEDIVISLQRIVLPPGTSTTRCFHRFFVLKFHLDKSSTGFVESAFYNYRPGTGLLVFPYQMHHLTETDKGGQLRLLINFTLPKQDEEMLRDLRNRPFRLTEADCRLLQEIVKLSDQNTALRLRCLIGELLLTLLGESVSEPQSVYSAPVRTIFDYLCDHCEDQISVKTLAAKFHCSESGIREMFRRETGQTPGIFLREMRLNKAARLLRTTGLDIDSIAAQCGFSNRYVFSRAFKNQFDLPPVRFRKEWFEY
jgi:AraC-like DNA-binding protein